MTQEKVNSLWHGIQTALLTLITGAATGCFIFLWDIKGFMDAQQKINEQNASNYETSQRVQNYHETQINNHEIRISILENENQKDKK